jgi:regulatory protein
LSSEVKLAALRLLARREHSQKELREKPKLRQFLDADVEAVLGDLKTQNLQSDKRYVESYVRTRIANGFGPLRLVQELEQRGISSETAQLAVSCAEVNWLQRASQLRIKKFGESWPINIKDRAKQQRFLSYRGFTHEIIRDLFKLSKTIDVP